MRIRALPLLLLISPFALAIVAAYVQWATIGLPATPAYPPFNPEADPSGFPAWLRLTHFVNFLFLVLLIRSGLQILMDHPRLYSKIHCAPGSEWARFTPIEVPKDRLWTANDDNRPLSPWIGLPGRRHTIGMARHWHFLSVLIWVLSGLTFVILLFATGQWRRLAPSSWQIVPDAWAVFVHYATLHLPPETDGFYRYNALQQLMYFGVVFILAPLAILTGPSMSPALTSRFRRYPKLPGNRQIGRSLHFLVMCAFVVFLVGHVSIVAITGLARNMNHIVMGTNTTQPAGIYWGLVGIGVVIGACALAYWAAWHRPRLVQHAAKGVVTPIMRLLLDKSHSVAEFTPAEISPYFWVNGKIPTSDTWKALSDGEFLDYRLRVFGLVENPVELSLEDLRALTKKTQITLHHCIQGWSGIAEWGGLPVAELIKLVRPKPEAGTIVFYSFGEGGEGGQFYDSLPISNALHPQTLLAYEMNYKPLGTLYGAPLRLRVENQLGFKMVKWIESIEFVGRASSVNQGEGGYKEDHNYFGELANM